MHHRTCVALLAAAVAVPAAVGICQEMPEPSAAQQPDRTAVPQQQQRNWTNLTPEQRAAATRAFLGLGPPPDKAAAMRGAPLFQRACAFCHGPQARGAEGPSLITSDEVLDDERGEHLVAFLKKGRPDKGMPSFAAMSDSQLTDIVEFLHQQVEDVANRGTYRLLKVLVGDPVRGKASVQANCLSCHSIDSFAHIAAKFRSPDQLQRGWIWPSRGNDASLAITATVKKPDGTTISGRVIEVSDFRITLADSAGHPHVIERGPGTEVSMHDPLAPHQALIETLSNDEMHNVTAFLETLK